MPYTFQSRATADLIMLKATAEQVLKLLDKSLNEPGIVTVEQIPQVIEVLEHAIRDDDARRQAVKKSMENMDAHAPDLQSQLAQDSERLGPVSLHQRLVPLIDMLRRSANDNKPVTWKFA